MWFNNGMTTNQQIRKIQDFVADPEWDGSPESAVEFALSVLADTEGAEATVEVEQALAAQVEADPFWNSHDTDDQADVLIEVVGGWLAATSA